MSLDRVERRQRVSRSAPVVEPPLIPSPTPFDPLSTDGICTSAAIDFA
jgi:hypothetical protein